MTYSEDGRIPIERIEADGKITKGSARQRGVTIDDFRNERGIPMNLPPGASFVVVIKVEE